jgi:cystathionine beta-lyase
MKHLDRLLPSVRQLGWPHPATERTLRTAYDAFVDALKLFRIGYSWAGPVSLVVAYDLRAMRARPRWRGLVVRFSLGLEDVEDLIADCDQALAALAAA